MKKKKGELTYDGVWFNSESGEKLPGLLLIDQVDFNQTLKLYSKVSFENVSLSRENHDFTDEQTICGDCELDNKITLEKCIYKGKNHIGDGCFEIIFEPTFTYRGGISFNIRETKIFTLTCTYPFFASWYDTDRLFFGSHFVSSNYLEDLTPAIKPEGLVDEIELDDEFTILIERRYRKESWKGNEAKIKVNHFVHFTCKNPKPFKDFQNRALTLMQLIKLSTGKLMYVDYVSIIVDNEELHDFKGKYQSLNGNVQVYITNYNSLLKRRLFEKDKIVRNNLLFYGGEKRYERLHQIIKNWFSTYENYKSIYNIFLDTFEWFENTEAYLSEIMFYNRFLNLIQALENFHYIRNDKKSGEDKKEVNAKAADLLNVFENKEDKEWLINHIHPNHIQFRTRLENIILEEFKYITDVLFSGNKKKQGFVERIKEFRDKLSHGEKIGLESDKMTDYYYKTQLILLACILDNLGFSNKEIGMAYYNTIRYSSMVRYIKDYWNNRKKPG